MIIELCKYEVMMINTLSSKRGLPRTYSPCTIMMGKQLDFKKQCRCPFGAYIQSHNNRNMTNLMVDCTQGAKCLGRTGNLHGYYAFLSPHTGRKITRSQFTELPTPTHVTRQVISMTMH